MFFTREKGGRPSCPSRFEAGRTGGDLLQEVSSKAAVTRGEQAVQAVVPVGGGKRHFAENRKREKKQRIRRKEKIPFEGGETGHYLRKNSFTKGPTLNPEEKGNYEQEGEGWRAYYP